MHGNRVSDMRPGAEILRFDFCEFRGEKKSRSFHKVGEESLRVIKVFWLK